MWNRFSIAKTYNQRWMSVCETGTHSFKGDMSKSLDTPPPEKKNKIKKIQKQTQQQKQKTKIGELLLSVNGQPLTRTSITNQSPSIFVLYLSLLPYLNRPRTFSLKGSSFSVFGSFSSSVERCDSCHESESANSLSQGAQVLHHRDMAWAESSWLLLSSLNTAACPCLHHHSHHLLLH